MSSAVFDGIVFDATPYFQTASDESIIALARCGWGGDGAADDVAMALAGEVDDLRKMFAYIEAVAHGPRQTGFECRVDESSALRWLQENRPGLYRRLQEMGYTPGAEINGKE